MPNVRTGVLFLGLLVLTGLSLSLNSADRSRGFWANLDGYQEVPAVSSPASGEFEARLAQNGTIEYELTYSGFGPTVSASHIHLGRPGTTGGVSAFLCGGGDKPACPANAGTVTGTIDPADVVGPEAQGIAPGEFEDLLAAMRAGATYANVHSPTFPGGEIRGAIRGFHGRGRERGGPGDGAGDWDY